MDLEMPEKSPIATAIDELLMRKKVATLDELKTASGADVGMTVYRALKGLGYRTSYSHNGRYYALDKTISFDDLGLWFVRSICFSRHGTLLKTLQDFVSDSAKGYFANELTDLLRVEVKESLLRLFNRGVIWREKVHGSFLYCSNTPSTRRKQLAERQTELAGTDVNIFFEPGQVSDEVKAAIILFTALLNEQQRRLFAGVEVLQFGRASAKWIAQLLNIHPQTVVKGKEELLAGNVDVRRIRKPGAGRHSTEKKVHRSSKSSKD